MNHGFGNMDAALYKRALALSYFTVGYNILEGVVSIVFGWYAGSVALVGFGSDSFVESLSGAVMVWRFRRGGTISPEEEERVEKRATRLVGYALFSLGAYVLYEAVKKLWLHEPPDRTLVGIAIAVISLLVMPLLFVMKRRTAVALGSASLMVDSQQTLACILLSLSLLAGVGLNYLFGLWQADPIAGLVIVVFLAKEGWEALREGKACRC